MQQRIAENGARKPTSALSLFLYSKPNKNTIKHNHNTYPLEFRPIHTTAFSSPRLIYFLLVSILSQKLHFRINLILFYPFHADSYPYTTLYYYSSTLPWSLSSFPNQPIQPTTNPATNPGVSFIPTTPRGSTTRDSRWLFPSSSLSISHPIPSSSPIV